MGQMSSAITSSVDSTSAALTSEPIQTGKHGHGSQSQNAVSVSRDQVQLSQAAMAAKAANRSIDTTRADELTASTKPMISQGSDAALQSHQDLDSETVLGLLQ